MAVFQLLLALYCAVEAVQRGRVVYYLLAGVALGLSWYIYAANQVVPLIVFSYIAYKVLSSRGYVRRDLWKLLLFLAVFALVSLPQIRYHLAHGQLLPVKTPYRGAAPEYQFHLERLGENVKLAARYLYSGGGDPWFAKPDGIFGITEGTVLIPGLVLCLGGLSRARRRDGLALLLIWFLLSMLPGILSGDPTFRRLILLTAAALCVSSLALRRWLKLASRSVTRFVLAAICMCFGLIYTAVNTHIYFDLVVAEESNGSVSQSKTVRQLRASWGKEFVYVYAFNDDQRNILGNFIRAGMYPQLNRRVEAADFFQVVVQHELESALANPRRINHKFRILANSEDARGATAGLHIREVIRSRCPRCVEETLSDPRGREILISWKSDDETSS